MDVISADCAADITPQSVVHLLTAVPESRSVPGAGGRAVVGVEAQDHEGEGLQQVFQGRDEVAGWMVSDQHNPLIMQDKGMIKRLF